MPGKPGEALAFAGKGIPVSPGGMGEGEVKLALVSQAKFGLSGVGEFKTPKVTAQTSKTEWMNNNYVEFDCDGFKGFKLSGQMTFCGDKVRPVENDVIQTDRLLTADVVVEGTRWPNFIATASASSRSLGENEDLTFQPAARTPGQEQQFALAGYESMYWGVGDLVIDNSEVANAPALQFPAKYAHGDLQRGANGSIDVAGSPAWRGVYVSGFSGFFAEAFERDNGEELSFQATNMIVDATGVTLDVEVNNIVTYEEANIAGWGVGIEKLVAGVLQNRLTRVEVKGKVKLPTSNSNDNVLGYTGQYTTPVNNGDLGAGFTFSMSAPSDLSFDMWSATLAIDGQSSTLEIGKKRIAANGNRPAAVRYAAEAILNGKLALNGAGDIIDIDDIKVERFFIGSESPYFGLADNGRLWVDPNLDGEIGAFKMGISSIGLVNGDDKLVAGKRRQLGLEVGAYIGLMEGGAGFGVGATVAIFGQVTSAPDLVSSTGRDFDFGYAGYEVTGANIVASLPGVSVVSNGGLAWKKGDAVYGNGFQGSLQAKFDALELEAEGPAPPSGPSTR